MTAGRDMLAKTLLAALAVAALAPGAWADDAPPGPQEPSKGGAEVVVGKAAAEGEAVEESALTQESAKLAAMLAVAFDRLPGAILEGDPVKVLWKPVGPFKKDGVKLGRLAVFLQVDGRTYAGVEFLPQEGDAIAMRGYEFETPENGLSGAKVKVAEKDSSSTNYIMFERSSIEAEAQQAIREILKGAEGR